MQLPHFWMIPVAPIGLNSNRLGESMRTLSTIFWLVRAQSGEP